MAEIVPIKTVAVKINEDTVAMLRELLAEAESGDLQSVAVVGFRADKDYFTRFSAMVGTLEKIGALALLKADLIKFVGGE